MTTSEWSDYSKKHLRHPNNAEFVTGRVNIINERNVVRISIGKVVCNLLELKRSDRVSVALHKENKNFLLMSKTNAPHSYMLCESPKINAKSNFLSATFRYDFNEPFRISQTCLLDFDINDNKLLLIDLEKLKWRE